MTPDQLADATAFLFGVRRADIFSDSRVVRVTEARQALAWALRQRDWSLEAIGMYLRRDHTTIIYALKVIEQRATHCPRLAERLQALVTNEAPPDWQSRIIALEVQVKELQARLEARDAAVTLPERGYEIAAEGQGIGGEA